ncbi:MAG: hypothetical protein J5985_05495 [Kiritimatiellae bacterium]|nr:hypothetical protein [Kiritimatiellia bacterium]
MQTPSTDRETVRELLLLLAGLAVVALAAGASRRFWKGWQMAPFADILRWREAFSMFLFAPALAVLFWFIVRCTGRGRMHPAIKVVSLLAVYFLACGMGMHDPANRMCGSYPAGAMQPAVRQSLVYFDDVLGHQVFWTGFVLATWALGVQQVLTPLDGRLPRFAGISLGAVDLALLFVFFTNLAFEFPNTKQDCRVILAAAALPTAVWLFRMRGRGLLRMPMLLVILPVCWGSVALTWGYWLFKGIP